MPICEFKIHVQGPEADQKRLASWLRSLPRCDCRDPRTPICVLLETVLADVVKSAICQRQTYFWADSKDFVRDVDGELILRGELRDTPPLLLMKKMFQLFPELTIHCRSSIENEWYEHWRINPETTDCERVEELLFNWQTNHAEKHYLKEGEQSVFDNLPYGV